MSDQTKSIIESIQNRDDVTPDQLLEAARIQLDLDKAVWETANGKLEHANEQRIQLWNVIPWAALFGLISAVLVAWLNGNFTIQESQSNNTHELRASELAYMQTFASGLFDAEGDTAEAKQLEQRRKICTSAKLGTLRIPTYLLVDHAEDKNPLVAYLNAEFECDNLGTISLPESAPTGPENNWLQSFRGVGTQSYMLPPELIAAVNAPWDQLASNTENISNLNEDNTDIRRTARSRLIEAGLPIVPELLSQLRADPENYRTLLGSSIILSGIIQNGGLVAPSIRELLRDTDITIFLGAAVQKDKTLRQSSTQLLSLLKDGRIPSLAINEWAETSETNLNGRYNLAFLINNAAEYVAPENQADLVNSLEEITATTGPRTEALLRSAIAKLS